MKHCKTYKNLFFYIKMSKDSLTFSNIEIKKINFTPTFLKYVDTEKVLVSNKSLLDEKNAYYWLLVQ